MSPSAVSSSVALGGPTERLPLVFALLPDSHGVDRWIGGKVFCRSRRSASKVIYRLQNPC